MKKWLKPLGLMAFLVIFCTIAAKLLSGNETLEDYAKDHPELAYASAKPTKEVVPDSTLAVTPAPTILATPTTAPTATPAPTVAPLSAPSSDAVCYQDGFFYEPLPQELIDHITGISYPSADAENIEVTYDQLRYLRVLYCDFKGEVQTGELICNKAIAQDLIEIFYELYQNDYQIESIKLIDAFSGDDTTSMAANNSSCFNYRVVDGSTHLSKHAYGLAIDINPFYNPYVVYEKGGSGDVKISPPGSEIYADRTQDFPYKIDENDLCYKLFKEHGFTWGGNWNNTKDYQHFQKKVQ